MTGAAFRMNVGLRVRRGLLAALIMFAEPVAATLLWPPASRDGQLSVEMQSKPRGTLLRPMIQSDTQRIAEICRRSGECDVSVNPEIIEQPNKPVDLVFTITEGANATTA
jgi:hypothetical protein